MKKSRVLSLALAAALLVTSVAAGPEASAAKKKAKKVSLSKKKQTLYVGKSVTIKVKNGVKKAKVAWSLSNKKKYVKLSKKKVKGNKASVKVTAKKKGTVKLIAKYKLGKKTTKLQCKFTVKKKKPSTPTTAPVVVQTPAPTNPVVVPPVGNPTATPTQPAYAGDPTAAPTATAAAPTATAVAPTATPTATVAPATPTPTATDEPKPTIEPATPSSIEIEGKEVNIDGVAHYEYSVPATAQAIEINATRNGETYAESVDVETFDAAIKMIDQLDTIYSNFKGTIYDTVDAIANSGKMSVTKEVGNAEVTIKKEADAKVSVTVDNNGNVQKAEAVLAKTSTGYDVTVTAKGKSIVVKVDKDAKNKVVAVKGDRTYSVEAVVKKNDAKTYSFKIETGTGRSLEGTVENSYADGKTWSGTAKTESGREINFTYDISECDQYVYSIKATCGGYVVSLVRTESDIVVTAPKKLVDKVNGKLEDKEISYKVSYVG